MAPTAGYKTKATKVTGRQTNNSLASATGQILIQNKANRLPSVQTPDTEILCQTDEDVRTGMYKILEYLKSHDDAWPFIDPVEEEYAPNYYTIIRRPMDLQRMEDKLDSGEYTRFSAFRSDFQLLVNNCRLYNGQDNEYTEMVDNLQQAFVKATNRFLEQTSSDEEIDFPIKPVSNLVRGRPKLKEKEPSIDIKAKKNVQSNSKTKRSGSVASNPVHKRQRSPEESPTRKKKKINSKDSPISEIKSPVKAHKKSKKRVAKNEIKTTSNKHHEEIESDLSQIKIEESEPPKRKSPQKDKTIITDKKSHKNSNMRKTESGYKKKVGRPSKKKKRNKYKKKHSKRSARKNQEYAEKKSMAKEMLDSEDDISSRSRSPTPLHSCSDNSGNELFGLDNVIPSKKRIPVKSHEKLPAENEDKFDKIKNRHKVKTKIAKSKSKDSFNEKNSLIYDSDAKTPLNVGDRNLKLSDTIEKLRAKNEKSKERAVLFDEIFGRTQPTKKVAERKLAKDEYEFIDESETSRKKTSDKKSNKKLINADRSMDALEAETEQTLKDMNKWFTESQVGNLSQHIAKSDKKKNIAENVISSSKKSEKDMKIVDKNNLKKDVKDVTKRKFLRDSMKQLFSKKREVQRTIDRLQPGKSKGNLINSANIQPITKSPVEECSIPSIKPKEVGAQTAVTSILEICPKLSLGSVLPTDGFGLVQQHNFNDDNDKTKTCVSSTSETSAVENDKDKDLTQVNEISSLKSPEEEVEVEKPFKACQEKATPNLSAWFKAFGAPKNPKKKTDDMESCQQIVIPTQSNCKSDQTEHFSTQEKVIEMETECPDNSMNLESPESNPTPRTRRTSTGSTISDRSNFSQDLDSPKIGMEERINSSYPLPYPSPINKNIVSQSKISPKSEDIHKSINVGFYQDTTTKSSPEKSCSPQALSPTVQMITSSASASHVYPSQNSPNSLQAYSYPNIANYDQIPRSGANNTIPYYETPKPYEYKAPILQDNADYVSLSPNNSSKTFSQPNTVGQQSSQPSYDNSRHLTGPNQVALGPNSPFSCSNHSSPYSNSDLSSPYGTPQPNSPYSLQTTQLSPSQTVSITYPKKRALIDEKNNPRTQSLPSSNISIQTEKNQMNSNIQQNEINIKKSPIAELINMGYSKPDDKLEQILANEKGLQNVKLNVNTDICKSSNLSNHEIKSNSSENIMKKGFDKPLNKPLDIFNPASVVFGHSGMSSNFASTPNTQILSQKCTEMLNLNYENCNTDMRKITKPDDANIIHYKHSQLSKNIPSPNTSLYSDIYSKNMNRVSDMIEMTDSNTKNSVANKLSTASNHHHNEFLNYPSRNLTIPGMNLNINQSNSNIHIPNSFSNIESRVPPNAHIGLTLTQPTSLHPRNYDIHNPSNANMDLNNPNYKFNSASSPMEQSIRKLSNITQIAEHHAGNEYRTPPVSNYYEAKTLQLQPQNAHSVSIASMQMFPQSQTLSMAYNRQSAVNTSNVNIQPHIQSAINVPDVTKITQAEQKKAKPRKKKTAADTEVIAQQGFQTYAGAKPTANESPASIALKGKNIPGSAFNFGSTQSPLNIPSALYNTGESYLDEYRSNTNPYYLAHRPPTQEQDKNRSNQAVNQFQYLGAPTPRSTDYPFIGSSSGALDSTSPLYQQYLQRHQEDLLRQQTNAQAQMLLNQGLLSNHAAYASPRYHPSLGIRQTFDPMNPRPPWL